MAEKTAQTYDSHTKIVPLYHYVAGPIFLVNLIWALYRVIGNLSLDALLSVVVALALVMLFFFARVFALGAQDRVIRLEEHLRLHRVLPNDLKAGIGNFTIDQLVALRFASDDELPGLVRQILEEDIGDRKTIKQMITNWRADHQRL